MYEEIFFIHTRLQISSMRRNFPFIMIEAKDRECDREREQT